jgi:hypothetical protein
VPPPAPPGIEWHSLFFAARRNEHSLRVSLFSLLHLAMMPPCDLHSAGRDQGRRKHMSSEQVQIQARAFGLPTASGWLAVQWVSLNPEQRQRTASLFLGLRQIMPEAKCTDPCRMWGPVADLVQQSSLLPMKGESILSKVTRSGSDPEGLAFIDHMDSIAREAVGQHLLPVGSQVFGCIATRHEQEG